MLQNYISQLETGDPGHHGGLAAKHVEVGLKPGPEAVITQLQIMEGLIVWDLQRMPKTVLHKIAQMVITKTLI